MLPWIMVLLLNIFEWIFSSVTPCAFANLVGLEENVFGTCFTSRETTEKLTSKWVPQFSLKPIHRKNNSPKNKFTYCNKSPKVCISFNIFFKRKFITTLNT